jgi:hypothetical protein
MPGEMSNLTGQNGRVSGSFPQLRGFPQGLIDLGLPSATLCFEVIKHIRAEAQ